MKNKIHGSEVNDLMFTITKQKLNIETVSNFS